MAGTQADPAAPALGAGGRQPGPGVRALRILGRVLLRQPRWLAWVLPAAWAALIFYLSSFQPDLGGFSFSPLPGLMTNLAHPGIFGLLTLFLVPVFARARGVDGRPWTALGSAGALWLVVLVTLYGFSDELHQSTVEGRDASVLDLLSDFVGALFVVIVVRYLSRADATDRGLRVRLLLGLFASIAGAVASALWDTRVGEPPWPF